MAEGSARTSPLPIRQGEGVLVPVSHKAPSGRSESDDEKDAPR